MENWKSVVTKNVLSEATGPKYDELGVPRCTDDLCAQFDGKRCRLLGCQPSSICEPAVVEMAAILSALDKAVP